MSEAKGEGHTGRGDRAGSASAAPPPAHRPPFRLSPFALPPIVWGFLVPLGYASTNLCLRAAAVQTDPTIGAMIRAIPTCLFTWFLIWRAGGVGAAFRLPPAILLPLFVVSILYNVTGNASTQLALAVVGLSVTAPISGAGSVWGGGIGGWLLMREGIPLARALGLLVLLAALPLLTSGGGGGTGPLWLGVLAAAVAGFSYGSGNALLRRTLVEQRIPQAVALAPMSTAGITMLFVLAMVRVGPAGFEALTPVTVGWLLLAGVFNTIALMSLSRALSLLPVTSVNAYSTLQTAVSSIAGVLIFAEPFTGALAAGLVLAVVGTILAQRAR